MPGAPPSIPKTSGVTWPILLGQEEVHHDSPLIPQRQFQEDDCCVSSPWVRAHVESLSSPLERTLVEGQKEVHHDNPLIPRRQFQEDDCCVSSPWEHTHVESLSSPLERVLVESKTSSHCKRVSDVMIHCARLNKEDSALCKEYSALCDSASCESALAIQGDSVSCKRPSDVMILLDRT